ASDVLGVDNMIKNDETGLLVQVKNESALCNRIIYLIDNPDLADRLAGNAFNFAKENYSNKKMLQSYKAIFTD
ncbi:MAG TPA: hypothetical protein PK987_07050, partial [Ferruginibacter sp.]|nr:hypothetical protein [Ferruginibacter sp.]